MRAARTPSMSQCQSITHSQCFHIEYSSALRAWGTSTRIHGATISARGLQGPLSMPPCMLDVQGS
eukprot:6209055-Amphidinium_carterae.1